VLSNFIRVEMFGARNTVDSELVAQPIRRLSAFRRSADLRQSHFRSCDESTGGKRKDQPGDPAKEGADAHDDGNDPRGARRLGGR
jgi:hypothetical protein